MATAAIVIVACFLGPVAFAAAGVLLPRRCTREILCPSDDRPRQVVFVGHPLELDRWDDVVSCARCGEELRPLHPLKCPKHCLTDPEFSPRSFIVNR